MIWLRLFIPLAVFLLVAYYLTVLLQLFGIIEFTKQTIEPAKAIIPFYYWSKKTNKNKQQSKKQKDNGND